MGGRKWKGAIGGKKLKYSGCWPPKCIGLGDRCLPQCTWVYENRHLFKCVCIAGNYMHFHVITAERVGLKCSIILKESKFDIVN